MSKTDYFWTDTTQAHERLLGTIVLYDGQPVMIEDVIPHDDGIPRASIRPCAGGEDVKRSRKMLNSPKFEKFRKLPNLGWMNPAKPSASGVTAIYLTRRTMTTRQHGINGNNISVYNFMATAGGTDMALQHGHFNFASFMYDEGFCNSHNGIFPSLDRILANIKENTAIAYSRNYCVSRDGNGIRWLHRNLDKVGIFTGQDTLNLISKFVFLREEIMEDEAFTLNNIREL